eukprot:TRINITY_DN112525_c0_g1_i1.p1 TRINITY_DN112525_c0_g1~~TRINITY_DN112525_c0_g1_i1.p1  ORF type:complete len:453 (-),score=87.68 TRINITY_DN112525_c0_g1_i1:56-1414(-)
MPSQAALPYAHGGDSSPAGAAAHLIAGEKRGLWPMKGKDLRVEHVGPDSAAPRRSLSEVWSRATTVLGPGIMVCLADSDIGGIFTMAAAGSRCSYVLLPMQLLLIVPLFMAQELTIRIGVYSHRSLCGLVFDKFGSIAGALVLAACFGVCSGAVISEFTGVAAVGELWGVPRWISCSAAAGLLSTVILSSSFARIEQIGIGLGMCLAVFLVVGYKVHPGWHEMQGGMASMPERLHDPKVRELVAANIGTVVTPWMLFYQLSAIVQKRLTPDDAAVARADTAVGAVLTQVVMASVLVTYARLAAGRDLESLPIMEALVLPLRPVFGTQIARIIMSAGLIGSSMLATLVASLALAWNFSDAIGVAGDYIWRIGVLVALCMGSLLVGFELANLVVINIFIQVVNGVAMPLTVGFLYALACTEVIPARERLQGWYAYVCGGTLLSCSCVCVFCAFF